jgi:hypothetical protein
MAHPTKSDKKLQAPKRQAQEQRRARLVAELRANLHKRKEQARGRAPRDVAGGTGEESKPEPGEAQVGRAGEVA